MWPAVTSLVGSKSNRRQKGPLGGHPGGKSGENGAEVEPGVEEPFLHTGTPKRKSGRPFSLFIDRRKIELDLLERIDAPGTTLVGAWPDDCQVASRGLCMPMGDGMRGKAAKGERCNLRFEAPAFSILPQPPNPVSIGPGPGMGALCNLNSFPQILGPNKPESHPCSHFTASRTVLAGIAPLPPILGPSLSIDVPVSDWLAKNRQFSRLASSGVQRPGPVAEQTG